VPPRMIAALAQKGAAVRCKVPQQIAALHTAMVSSS
jgi:hypothetical protein